MIKNSNWAAFPVHNNTLRNMRTTKRWLLLLAMVVLAGYSVSTTLRVRQLEARLSRVEQAQRASTAPATPIYAFDDSFRQYFGQSGMEAAERAIRRGVTDPEQIEQIVREATLNQPSPRLDRRVATE